MGWDINSLLIALTALGFVALLVLGLRSNQSEKAVETRIQSLTLPAPRKLDQLNREKALQASFEERVIFPLAQKIFDKTQSFIPLSSKSWVKAKLIQAGYNHPKYPKLFLGTQLLIAGGVLGLFFLFTSVFGKFSGVIGIVVTVFFGALGYCFPMLWLIQQAQKRQEGIQKSLPDFLDILVICVEAGLSLDTAIQRITTLKSVKTSAFLRQELNHYLKDINIGKPRKEALLDLGQRTGLDDFNTVVGALAQAYEMGTSVAHTLRVQSDTMRVKRLQQAEEKANKIPVKMVLPIYIFLFPTIFLSIFGPIGMVMFKTLMKIFSQMKQMNG
jgi:tight adherence protein C